jgi:hypothetical protein
MEAQSLAVAMEQQFVNMAMLNKQVTFVYLSGKRKPLQVSHWYMTLHKNTACAEEFTYSV